MPDFSPRAPFETWKVQLRVPSLGTYIWYAQPAVFITQVQQPIATPSHAVLIANAMDLVLRRFKHEVEMHNGLLVLHDWRAIDVYEPATRAYYTKRLETYRRGAQRGAVICGSQSPLVRAMLQLGAIALPFRTGRTVQLVNDLLPLIAQHNIEPVTENPFRELRPESLLPANH